MGRCTPQWGRTMPDPVEEAADRLYDLPLEDFTRERDALARELRRDGDREAAAAVKELGKPSQAAWIVNRLARDEPELVGELIAAGDRLRKAQEDALGGAGGAGLREAAAAERAAVDAIVGAAGGLRPGGRKPTRATTDRLRETLHAAAGDEQVRERVRAGRLAEEAQGAGAWPMAAAGAEAPSTGKPAGKAKAGKAPKPAKPAKADDAAAREGREAKAREREEARAREREAAEERKVAEHRKLEQALRTARKKATGAGKRLDYARKEADLARDRLEAARADDEAARDEVARLEEQLG